MAAPLGRIADASQLGQILATIRYLESRGIYTLPPNRGNASGAYQFIESTWARYAGYQHAYLAPPEVQDQRAGEDVIRFLERWNNDVSMIPVMWYYPLAASNPELMDIVPVPQAGNVLTVREYQARWLAVFATISGRPVAPIGSFTTAPALGAPPVVPERRDNRPSIAFPVLGPTRLATPDCDTAAATDTTTRSAIDTSDLCTSEAPAIVFGTQLQPVLAAADGVVTDVVDRPGTTAPISVTITDERGRSYVYRGFNDDSPSTDDGMAPPHLRLSGLARVGETVRAGQVIGFMGNTDPLPSGVDAAREESGTAHIRLEIYDLDGRALDAYGPVIDALFLQTCAIGAGPWSMPENGAGHAPFSVAPEASDATVESRWSFTGTGQVTASGWAALINPQDSCEAVPAEAHGPGAAGPLGTPSSWASPIQLPTAMWVTLAMTADEVGPNQFLRRT